MDPVSLTVCHLQAFTANCKVTLWPIGPILKIRRKLSVVNTHPDPSHVEGPVLKKLS